MHISDYKAIENVKEKYSERKISSTLNLQKRKRTKITFKIKINVHVKTIFVSKMFLYSFLMVRMSDGYEFHNLR